MQVGAAGVEQLVVAPHGVAEQSVQQDGQRQWAAIQGIAQGSVAEPCGGQRAERHQHRRFGAQHAVAEEDRRRQQAAGRNRQQQALAARRQARVGGGFKREGARQHIQRGQPQRSGQQGEPAESEVQGIHAMGLRLPAVCRCRY